jgi:hypothetical protein
VLTYFLDDFEMVPVAPVITGITLVFIFHIGCIYILRSLYFKIFSASFLITFLSPGIATSTNIHVPFSLSRITMSGLLLGMVLSVCTCWFHSMVTLPPWLVSTHFGTCSYQCFLFNCTLVYYYYYCYYWSWCNRIIIGPVTFKWRVFNNIHALLHGLCRLSSLYSWTKPNVNLISLSAAL